MKSILAAFAVLVAPVTLSAIDIVPNPVSMEQGEGSVSLRKARIAASGQELQDLVATFLDVSAEDPSAAYGKACMKCCANVRISVDTTLAEEGYTLTAAGRRIDIVGGSVKGVWWGLQTLRQIFVQAERDGKRFVIPEISIKDQPGFAYRGAHLDVSRHFFSVDVVKGFIDEMVMHKLNKFHWHLTDNEGWRIEIKRYPALTEIGSVRAETVIGHYYLGRGFDGTPYGGFYTQDEIRDIVAYAAARQVEVIPEIEMPGHCVAALASYQYLGCRGEGYSVGRGVGSTPDVYCPGKETTFEFLEGVIDEVCELFPTKYFHIGGDEVNKSRWAECPHCRARMEAEGIEDVNLLQNYFVDRIEKYLISKGRRMIGWDEILEGGVSQSAVVMSWRGSEGGIKAAQLGNDAIMSPSTGFYFDSPQYDDYTDVEDMCAPIDYRTYHPLSETYSFNPFDQLTPEQRVHILGIQGNTWTELISDTDRMQLLNLPRFAALGECAWGSEKTDFDTFVRRTWNSLVPIYTAKGYNYADREFKKLGLE